MCAISGKNFLLLAKIYLTICIHYEGNLLKKSKSKTHTHTRDVQKLYLLLMTLKVYLNQSKYEEKIFYIKIIIIII